MVSSLLLFRSYTISFYAITSEIKSGIALNNSNIVSSKKVHVEYNLICSQKPHTV